MNHRLCSDGASLQERLLRLPYYAHCWPETAKRDRHLNLTAAAKRPSPLDRLLGQMDSSRNTSAIDLSGLNSIGDGSGRRGRSGESAGGRRAGPVAEVPLGVFLFQNYRCELNMNMNSNACLLD